MYYIRRKYYNLSKMSHPVRKGYLSHRRTAKAQASLHIHAVSLELLLLAPTLNGTRGNFREIALLRGCACGFEQDAIGTFSC